MFFNAGNVQKPNVWFEQRNKILFSLKLFSSSQTSDNHKNPVWNRFGTGFVFDKPNNFVRISDSAKIQTVWEWNTFQNVRNPNVRISDTYCFNNLSL